MSASLVGSEMCIRDSSSSGRSRAKPERAQHGLHVPNKCRAARPKAPTPVSYTHLTLPTICSV
eukprot:4132001-Alexandrium_andersonii.AAC.1